MAKGNTYTCKTCGKEYIYCPNCDFVHPNYDAEAFCCGKHADIFAILSKNGCHLATAEETLKSLAKYDLTGLAPSIQAHIDSLKPEVKVSAKEIKAPVVEK